ncbi:hypothetical protein TNCV_4148491 [Trichonephila clavipes]|nr:hypothetical protein TNCV_4148491 [Trichonephila clavipes]
MILEPAVIYVERTQCTGVHTCNVSVNRSDLYRYDYDNREIMDAASVLVSWVRFLVPLKTRCIEGIICRGFNALTFMWCESLQGRVPGSGFILVT